MDFRENGQAQDQQHFVEMGLDLQALFDDGDEHVSGCCGPDLHPASDPQHVDYADWLDRKLAPQALRPIYSAAHEEAALDELRAFANGPWGLKYPRPRIPGHRHGNTWSRISGSRRKSEE